MILSVSDRYNQYQINRQFEGASQKTDGKLNSSEFSITEKIINTLSNIDKIHEIAKDTAIGSREGIEKF